MSTAKAALRAPISAPFLFGLSARLTVGSAVCFTEGFAASVMLFAPLNQWFFVAGLLLAFIAWLSFWRFRDTTIGADVGDLYFYNFVAYGICLIAYLNGKNCAWLWYVVNALAILRIIRVYIWQSSSTQQHGWGKFGILTWHQKHHLFKPELNKPWKKLAPEIIGALLMAMLAAITIKQLPEIGRVAVIWVVPLAFEFLYGPRQLRDLAEISKHAQNTTSREDEKDAEIARLKSALEARNNQIGPEDETISAITATAQATTPRMREHILLYARNVASQFPDVSQNEN